MTTFSVPDGLTSVESMDARRVSANSPVDPSSLLAARMLEGWAMLGTHCPSCYSPIMRDRERRMFCVVCDVRVITEEEAAQQRVQEIATPVTNPSNVPESSGRALEREASETREREEGFRVPAHANSGSDDPVMARTGGLLSGDNGGERGVERGGEEGGGGQRAGISCAEPGVSSWELPQSDTEKVGNIREVSEGTLKMLVQKLQATRILTTSCTDTFQLSKLLALIGEIVYAIKAVKSLTQDEN